MLHQPLLGQGKSHDTGAARYPACCCALTASRRLKTQSLLMFYALVWGTNTHRKRQSYPYTRRVCRVVLRINFVRLEAVVSVSDNSIAVRSNVPITHACTRLEWSASE